jgi:hypothetical protein
MMNTVTELLAIIALLVAAYFLLSYLLYRRSWRSMERSFSPAWDTPRAALSAAKPCALAINGRLLAEGYSGERFSLARPFVAVAQHGIVFCIRPNPIRMFSPILVRYDQVESFSHVRDDAGEWVELEFSERGTRCWAHLPVELAKSLRAHGIARGVPVDRLRPLLDESDIPLRSPGAALYARTFHCNAWVAELLETLDDRDVVDAYHDVNALWGAAYEFHRQRTWTKATAMLADRGTSYWLNGALRHAQFHAGARLLNDVQQLLVIVRARMDHALGAAIPAHRLPSSGMPA